MEPEETSPSTIKETIDAFANSLAMQRVSAIIIIATWGNESETHVVMSTKGNTITQLGLAETARDAIATHNRQ